MASSESTSAPLRRRERRPRWDAAWPTGCSRGARRRWSRSPRAGRRHDPNLSERTSEMPRMTSPTEMRPLQGRTIVITRAAAQAQRFVDLLEAEGARVLAAPTIAIEPPPSWELLDAALDTIDSFTWV